MWEVFREIWEAMKNDGEAQLALGVILLISVLFAFGMWVYHNHGVLGAFLLTGS